MEQEDPSRKDEETKEEPRTDKKQSETDKPMENDALAPKEPRDEASSGGGNDSDTPVLQARTKRARIEARPLLEDNQVNITTPKYIPTQKALDVFSNPYFYANETFAKSAEDRRKHYLSDMTVGQVFKSYVFQQERGYLCDWIYTLPNRVESFFAPAYESVEAILALHEIIVLDGKEDVDKFDKRAVPLPILQDLLDTTTAKPDSKQELSRALKLALVLGSSGSGKTFFSLQYLAHNLHIKSGVEKKVTIYLYAKRAPGIKFFLDKEPNPEAAVDLCKWIKKATEEQINREIKKVLNMHVCIIIDEAGDLDIKLWFESLAMLSRLCHEAEKMADSVAVVVSGTGLTGQNLSSVDDAYVFRLKPWRAIDFVKVLERKPFWLSKGEETTRTVANVIYANPKLRALATNARSAYFLVDAIANMISNYTQRVWGLNLDAWIPTLVKQVVDSYISSNGIKDITAQQRRRVAASIFLVLQNVKWGHVAPPPTFVALEGKEIAVAESLVQYNVEHGKDKLKLLENENFAVTVTPAIAMVLYSMAGIPITLVSGWKGEEELAALYAVRQLMIGRMETFVMETSRIPIHLNRLRTTPEEIHHDALQELNKSLGEVCLLPLQKPLERAKPRFDKVSVPMVGKGAVLWNGDGAAFADIIAPQMFIQAKLRTTKQTLTVNIYDEVKKCGLFNERQVDARLLQCLMLLWQGDLGNNADVDNEDIWQQMPGRDPQRSKAFPENLLRLVPKNNPFEYALIEGDNITIGKETRQLPALGETFPISFILSTNVDMIKLELTSTGASSITITEENLDDSLGIRDDSLSEKDLNAWKNFKDKLRSGIQIKFLMTRSE